MTSSWNEIRSNKQYSHVPSTYVPPTQVLSEATSQHAAPQRPSTSSHALGPDGTTTKKTKRGHLPSALTDPGNKSEAGSLVAPGGAAHQRQSNRSVRGSQQQQAHGCTTTTRWRDTIGILLPYTLVVPQADRQPLVKAHETQLPRRQDGSLIDRPFIYLGGLQMNFSSFTTLRPPTWLND